MYTHVYACVRAHICKCIACDDIQPQKHWVEGHQQYEQQQQSLNQSIALLSDPVLPLAACLPSLRRITYNTCNLKAAKHDTDNPEPKVLKP